MSKPKQQIQWTLLPNGIRDGALRCSVFVSIQLTNAAESPGLSLSGYADLLNWPETLDRVDLFCGQCERLGADAPGDTLVFIFNPEETGGYRFVQVVRLLTSREIGNHRRTRHEGSESPLSTAVRDLRAVKGNVTSPHTTS